MISKAERIKSHLVFNFDKSVLRNRHVKYCTIEELQMDIKMKNLFLFAVSLFPLFITSCTDTGDKERYQQITDSSKYGRVVTEAFLEFNLRDSLENIKNKLNDLSRNNIVTNIIIDSNQKFISCDYEYLTEFGSYKLWLDFEFWEDSLFSLSLSTYPYNNNVSLRDSLLSYFTNKYNTLTPYYNHETYSSLKGTRLISISPFSKYLSVLYLDLELSRRRHRSRYAE